MADMEQKDPRAILERLIAERGDSYGAISRMLGRNSAYIQQFIKRGTPRRLDERDRHILARYFGVDEVELGGVAQENSLAAPQIRRLALVPRLALGASAGSGTLDVDERAAGAVGFDPYWLKSKGLHAEVLSIIQVDGESMAPTLGNGDDIMVDGGDAANRLRDGIYVLRLDDALMVKRVAIVSQEGRRAISVSSDNPHYPVWADIDPALIDIVGRVVWTGRRMP